MNRRDFIKQSTGGVAAFKRALILMAISIFVFLLLRAGKVVDATPYIPPLPESDANEGPSAFVFFLQVVGIIVGILVLLIILLLVVEFLKKRISTLIPQKIKNWYANNRKKIGGLLHIGGIFLYIGLIAFFIYYCLIKGLYFYMVFGLLYLTYSFFKNKRIRNHTTNKPV